MCCCPEDEEEPKDAQVREDGTYYRYPEQPTNSDYTSGHTVPRHHRQGSPVPDHYRPAISGPIMVPGSSISTGNPYFGPRKQLYCRTGYNIALYPDGAVKGSREPYSFYAILEFSSVAIGEVRIRGLGSGFYLAMNRKGRLYGEIYPEEEGTVFVEGVAGLYNTYLSRKYAHHGWFVAIKRSGKVKAGKQTNWGQKAIQFLPRPARPSGVYG